LIVKTYHDYCGDKKVPVSVRTVVSNYGEKLAKPQTAYRGSCSSWQCHMETRWPISKHSFLNKSLAKRSRYISNRSKRERRRRNGTTAVHEEWLLDALGRMVLAFDNGMGRSSYVMYLYKRSVGELLPSHQKDVALCGLTTRCKFTASA
jgi:hypothetical protein